MYILVGARPVLNLYHSND